MIGRKLGMAAIAALALGLVLAAPAAQARKKVITKTYVMGVGSPTGGVALPIPDGAGQATQLTRSPLAVRGPNPRGKIKDVNVGVGGQRAVAKERELYVGSRRGVSKLSREVGGDGNNYGAGPPSW